VVCVVLVCVGTLAPRREFVSVRARGAPSSLKCDRGRLYRGFLLLYSRCVLPDRADGVSSAVKPLGNAGARVGRRCAIRTSRKDGVPDSCTLVVGDVAHGRLGLSVVLWAFQRVAGW
jgi:hypothetical protein